MYDYCFIFTAYIYDYCCTQKWHNQCPIFVPIGSCTPVANFPGALKFPIMSFFVFIK